jgi:hypothetical protein
VGQPDDHIQYQNRRATPDTPHHMRCVKSSAIGGGVGPFGASAFALQFRCPKVNILRRERIKVG